MVLEFLKENRKSFPAYFRMKELKKYHSENKLFPIWFRMNIVGFFVLDDTMFKSLYIKKEYRERSSLFLKNVFDYVKFSRQKLTIAVNPRSKRMLKLCQKNNFQPTNEIVQGKTHQLQIYEWRKQT